MVCLWAVGCLWLAQTPERRVNDICPVVFYFLTKLKLRLKLNMDNADAVAALTSSNDFADWQLTKLT